MSDVPAADPISRNANVVTLTTSRPHTESIAVKDGRVLAVGADGELAHYRPAEQLTTVGPARTRRPNVEGRRGLREAGHWVP